MCVAAHDSAGPSRAMEPDTSNINLTMGWGRKLRCVSMRWKPTVTPSATSEYITANNVRSVALTARSHNSQIAKRAARKGTVTTDRMTIFFAGKEFIQTSAYSTPPQKKWNNCMIKKAVHLFHRVC